jgi:hypothetical protein
MSAREFFPELALNASTITLSVLVYEAYKGQYEEASIRSQLAGLAVEYISVKIWLFPTYVDRTSEISKTTTNLFLIYFKK